MSASMILEALTRILLLFFAPRSASAQGFSFVDFPANLTVRLKQQMTLKWSNQTDYVNVSLARFYWYGGGSEYHGLTTTFNKDTAFTYTVDSALEQGTYAFFISTPNQNSSESPFFTVLTDPGLVRPKKRWDGPSVGLGVGVTLTFLLVVLGVLYYLRRSRARQSRAEKVGERREQGEQGEQPPEEVWVQGKRYVPEREHGVAELSGESRVPELPASRAL